jgi:ubiquinone/menaquinone biosynthesis C-methylase UbiE
MEIECLRHLSLKGFRRWLEVGVGTGRFAEALGVTDGVDPSHAMLVFANSRGIHTTLGRGEELPYLDSSFDGLLMVTTLCFLADPLSVLKECYRVLRHFGFLVMGVIPSDSAWGKLYIKKGREGHPFYSSARFYKCDQIIHMTEKVGFFFDKATSCLLFPPGKSILCNSIYDGIAKNAGFVAMRFSLRDKKK